jgi:hypothetical protein
MHQIDTRIKPQFKELLDIFFKANEFTDVRIVSYREPENYGDQEMLRIFYSDDDESGIMFLGFKHAGILNMLDDYLMKCGKSPQDLHVREVLSTARALSIVLAQKENHASLS